MSGNLVAFVEEVPTFEIRGGLVHITGIGGPVADHVMSIHTFQRTLHRAQKLLAEWEIQQSPPIPFPASRDHAASP